MRADKYFAERFGSRTKAAEWIERGLVLVNDKTILPKTEIKEGDEICVLTPKDYFVSNGGYKLQRAIESFGFDCKDKIFADIGASTGGFTDCLLQHGAKRVYAVDVGESLLHPSLVKDERIIPMENVNARYLQKEDFPEPLDGVVADVSFISLRHIFPVIQAILGENGDAFVLIKPQFECEKKIGKSGIVPPFSHVEIVKKVLGYAKESELFACEIVNAPVRKGKNIEYILRLRKEPSLQKTELVLLDEVKRRIKSHSLGELL